MIEKMLIAGFGGQGVLTAGKLLAQSAMGEGLQVSYLPAYGSEVRGGTANCNLVVSDEAICSPVVEAADSLVVMNDESLERFGRVLKPGGLLVANTSLIDQYLLSPASRQAQVLEVDATNLAAELGNTVVANMVAMGAYLSARPLVRLEAFGRVLRETLGERKAELVEVNWKALRLGAAQAERKLSRT